MTCKCGSNRIVYFQGKHSDCASMDIDHLGIESDGDGIPHVGFEGFGGDYFHVKVCLDCGTIQDWKVVSDEDIKAELELDEDEDE